MAKSATTQTGSASGQVTYSAGARSGPLQVTLQAGRYLAKDLGATLRVSRSFSNGSSMGAFATKTNVSAAQFGEGSFNKGMFWSVPFDAFMTRCSR